MLNFRLWILIGVLALYPVVYLKGRHDGTKVEHIANELDKARANSEARALENRRQDRANESVALAAARASRITADAASARRESDGLRNDLDATKRYAAKSLDAATKSVAALSDVFEQCSRRYSDLAEVADRHVNDKLTLQLAWPQ